jgi:lipopolysaccharide/colanic/teichoic acid biosynthesis glycosyltransferase
MQQKGLRLLVKKSIDRLAAVAALVVLSPVLAATALAIYATMGAPAFFRQRRPGLHGKTIRIVKFRTMRDAIGPDGRSLPDSQRITRLGSLLRTTSLDELPQLWNVLRGDLSLVGPRPLLMQYLPRYSPEQARRHDVLPGITGWAQVNGRNALTWEEKFALDVWYVDHWSLALDARILAMTVRHLFKREGIAHRGVATMPEFMGTGTDAVEEYRDIPQRPEN